MPLSDPTAYRYPNEQIILTVTLLLVLAVIAVTATATLCGSLFFVALMIALSYAGIRSHHKDLIQGAQLVKPETAPNLAAIVRQCQARLQAGPVQTYVVPRNALNAYTFGLEEPKVVALYAPLLQVMDTDELRFVVGHELGHVRLGHTWLNSLVGGLAGIPSPFAAAVILRFAFRWWNRACEFSADRAGLLACGNPDKAVSALVRLATGAASRDPQVMARALQRVDAEDDDVGNVLMESLATHPMIIKRIEALRRFAESGLYKRLRGQIEQ